MHQSFLLSMMAAAIALSSCAPKAAPTGAVVKIDAEASIAADATILVVRVYGSDGTQPNGSDVLRDERTVQLGAGHPFPYTIGITPLGGDVTRLYRIEAEARDATGGLIAIAKAISGYANHRVLLVDLVFTEPCRSVTCADASLTCRAAVCVDAHVDPTTLPTYTTDAGTIGCDAGFYALTGGACVDVNECQTGNGGCDPLTACTNTEGGRTCGACPAGYVGTGDTGCAVPASCKALLDAGMTASGTYTIDPDGAGALAPFVAYCDLAGAGGGWTLIRSSTSGGTNASVEGLPTPATNLHLSAARMIALAQISQEVHIRTSGNPADAITSNPGTQPILGMRAGGPMYDANVTGCDFGPAADWTGPSNHLTSLYYSCCPLVSAYPNGVFHSCNFAAGLAWFGSSNGWTNGAVNQLELYFR